MPGPLDYLVPPPPMPGLLQSGTDGQPFYPSATNWGEQRDPFAFGAPRPPPAGDVVLPTARPGFADTMPRIPRSIHRNDARLFGGDFIPAAWQSGPGDGLPEAVRRSIAEQPSYSENEVSPPLASRRAGYDAYGAEAEAMRGQPRREQDLRDALAMRGYGSTIPTIEAQENSLYGQPISDARMSQMRQWWQENYPVGR